MLNDHDIESLLRMARESRDLEKSDRRHARRARVAVGLAAAGALAASVVWWRAWPTTPTPIHPLSAVPASTAPDRSNGNLPSRADDQGRVVLAVFRDGEQPPCVVHRDFRGVQGHALALLTHADLAQLAGPCESGLRRVLLIELAGPVRLLPLNLHDARRLVDCLDLAEKRMGDLGCAAATCVPPEVSVTTARLALGP
jgi:hypothetical protein